MTTVNWALSTDNAQIDVPIIKAYTGYAPEKVLTAMAVDEARKYGAEQEEAQYRKCFAYIDYMRNVYQIVAPFDITIHIDEIGRVHTIETPKPASSRIVTFRSNPSPSTNVLLSLAILYVFYSKDSVMLEQLPPFLDYRLAKEGVTVIPGTFDIGKWVRPVEVALEIQKGVRKVHIEKGTPLSYLRFVPSGGSTVTLVEEEDTEALRNIVEICTGLKRIQSKTPLKECYEKAKKVVDGFLRPSRCPFRRKTRV